MSDEKPQQPEEKPKIVVDEDWKAQAQAEKEKLAETDQAGGAPAGTGAAAAARGAGRELPPASFVSLVGSLEAQVLFALGAIPTSRGERYRDLELAKHHVDVLGVLEEKTRGNLTDEEKRTLDDTLYRVRMAYVETAGGGI